ncbi:hypothetical protein [Maritalea porphyrae]|uniref:hypothetical protein n=1 Tax=Maritalea porphyrae TaxID=880732 RepID=UPI0022AEFFB7|nr:hypothetical protein [Maritalea porphyrae]MCZ4274010.1 hypothetical protein [Maritalea porphyrae]
MAILRENLTSILSETDRPPIEQVAISMCKYANGRTNCMCLNKGLPICDGVKREAEWLYLIVEKDVNAKAAAKRKSTKDKAAATRSRKAHLKRLGVNDGE